ALTLVSVEGITSQHLYQWEELYPVIGISKRDNAPCLVSVGGIVPPHLASVGGTVPHHWCQWKE
ncbi:unnamed protein product, partial [Staurois parvus]